MPHHLYVTALRNNDNILKGEFGYVLQVGVYHITLLPARARLAPKL